MPPSSSTKRCSYREGATRCPRNGTSSRPGDPVLCRAHRLVMVNEATTPDYRPGQGLAGVLASVFRKRKVKDDDVVAAIMDAAVLGATFVNARQTSRGAAPPFPGVHQIPRSWAPPPRPQAPPPPPPPPGPRRYSDAEVAAAKRVLGFDDVYLVLTEDEIRKRKRELSRKHHPDLAGHNAADRKRRESKIREINNAADLLVATVKERGDA